MICLAKKLIANSYDVDNQGIISFEKSLRKRLKKHERILTQLYIIYETFQTPFYRIAVAVCNSCKCI